MRDKKKKPTNVCLTSGKVIWHQRIFFKCEEKGGCNLETIFCGKGERNRLQDAKDLKASHDMDLACHVYIPKRSSDCMCGKSFKDLKKK